VEIDVSDSDIITRMSGRRVHESSGRTYHIEYNPPKAVGKDDVTGDELVQRADDTEETVNKRLSVYHSQTKPLVTFYQNLSGSAVQYLKIEGVGAVTDIRDAVFTALEG